jgi:hypothetical protein
MSRFAASMSPRQRRRHGPAKFDGSKSAVGVAHSKLPGGVFVFASFVAIGLRFDERKWGVACDE